ncbi:MAG: ABC transporter substrate-binding protein, partial [Desulfovibrionaceae bacterium]|nr:ABC transporter substrate-binding protein [Desulfovibrionaceae bacterium]
MLASLLCAALLCLAPCAQADPAPAAQKVVRVAYVEGGPFVDYQLILRGIAVGLQRCGLIE